MTRDRRSRSVALAHLRPVRRSVAAALVAVAGLGTGLAPSAGAVVTAPAAVGPATPVVAQIAGAATPSQQLPIDLDQLETSPTPSWGVVGVGDTVEAPRPQVWDMEQIGDRIFVAGAFTGVTSGPAAAVVAQPYLAAFDVNSGAFIDSFRPTINRAVYALETLPSGSLLVGGEFSQVNGQPRNALVALNPTTGATDTTFNAGIGHIGPETRRIRELLVDGPDLYILGRFNQLYTGEPGSPFFVYNIARLRSATGLLDSSWVPRVSGSIWDIAVDPALGRVHLAGYFSSVNSTPGTANMATISRTDGSVVPGLVPFTPNDPSETFTHAVAVSNGRIYVGGADHVIQVLDATTNARLGWHATGRTCTSFDRSVCSVPIQVTGGDYQVIEVTDDTVLGGCHCFGDVGVNAAWADRVHYSSFSGQFTPHNTAIGYRAADSSVITPFVPALAPGYWGTWALETDTNGCLWVGGDYTRTDGGAWVGGMARFCEPVDPPSGVVASATGADALSVQWTTPASRPAPTRYAVYRNGTVVGETAQTSFTLTGVDPSTAGQVQVQAIDPTGRRSLLATATVVGSAARFVAQGPVRLVDTRESWSVPTGRLQPGQVVTVPLRGLAGIPANASAVALNVTATEAGSPGYVSITPSEVTPGATSSLNLTPTQTVANSVIVPLGADGAVNVVSQGGTHLVIDLAGWFEPSSATTSGRIVSLAPQRLFDTREPASTPTGFVTAGGVIRVPTAGRAGVPTSGAQAVVLNVTATEAAGPGYVTAFPGDGPPPLASTLNLERPGQTIANMAIVPLGADGSISFLSQSGAHLLADVVGYVTGAAAPSATTGLFVPVTPGRVFDTRDGGASPIGPAGTIDVAVAGQVGVPATAAAVVANVTATQAGGPGFVTVWNTGAPQPLASTLNLNAAGETRPNTTIARLGDGGRLSLYTQPSAHLLADVTGFLLG